MKIGISAWGAFGIGVIAAMAMAAIELLRVFLLDWFGPEAPGLVAVAVVIVVGLHMVGLIDLRKLLF